MPAPRRRRADLERESRDRLFAYFVGGIMGLMVLYGGGMVFVLVTVSETVGLRMVSGFASMFAGLLGLGTGYLLGQAGR